MTDDRDPVRDAFGNETAADLEACVPQELVDQVWPRVAAELAARPLSRAGRRARLPVALAAACVVMMSAIGWLAVENHRLRRRPAGTTTVIAPTPAGHTITVGDLVARLSRLAPDTEVLTTAEAEQLLRRGQPLLYAVLRGPRLDAVVEDGVTAAEAVAVLRRLDAGTTVQLGNIFASRTSGRS